MTATAYPFDQRADRPPIRCGRIRGGRPCDARAGWFVHAAPHWVYRCGPCAYLDGAEFSTSTNPAQKD